MKRPPPPPMYVDVYHCRHTSWPDCTYTYVFCTYSDINLSLWGREVTCSSRASIYFSAVKSAASVKTSVLLRTWKRPSTYCSNLLRCDPCTWIQNDGLGAHVLTVLCHFYWRTSAKLQLKLEDNTALHATCKLPSHYYVFCSQAK